MKILRCIFLFAVNAITSYGQSPEQNPIANTLAEMPLLPKGQAWAGQFSSHSPHQHNGDAGHYLYKDEFGDAVIFDVAGPGCIRSMWGTDLDTSSILKFYFDDEKQPRCRSEDHKCSKPLII